MRFRTKPFEIEAVQFDGKNWDEIVSFTSPKVINTGTGEETIVHKGFHGAYDLDDPEIIAEVFDYLHNTWVGVKKGQWIIKGAKGEFYPCDPEVFEAKYERVFTDEEKWATVEMDNGRKVRVPRRPLIGREELERGK